MADLVQLECLRGLTRAVRVSANAEDGILFFDQGQLVHAETRRSSGEDAALEILSWEEGTVEPSERMWLNAPTIETGWQGLLMRAAQRRDEAMSSRFPGPPSEVPPALEQIPSERESGSMWKGAEPLKSSDVPENSDILRSVRLDSEGAVLESTGDVGDFPDAAAYAVRLAQLIGDGLGLEDFVGLECVAPDRIMVTYVNDDEIVAVEARPGADVSEHRKKAGV